jgi:hypothetical protein
MALTPEEDKSEELKENTMHGFLHGQCKKKYMEYNVTPKVITVQDPE